MSYSFVICELDYFSLLNFFLQLEKNKGRIRYIIYFRLHDNRVADFLFFSPPLFIYSFFFLLFFSSFFFFFLNLRILNTNKNYTISAMRNLPRMAAAVEAILFRIIIRRFNFECATRPVFQYFYPVRIPRPSNGAK